MCGKPLVWCVLVAVGETEVAIFCESLLASFKAWLLMGLKLGQNQVGWAVDYNLVAGPTL